MGGVITDGPCGLDLSGAVGSEVLDICLGAVIDEHGYDRLSIPGERSTMCGTCRVCLVSE